MEDLLQFIRASLNWRSDSVRLSPTPGSWARQNLFYIQEIGRFRTLPGYLTERKDLDSVLMIYTRAGKGKLNINNQSYSVQRDEFLWIDCIMPHVYMTDSDDGWDFDWVHFNGPGIRSYLSLYQDQLDYNPVRIVDPSSKIADIFDELMILQEDRGLRQELIVSKLLLELATEAVLLDMNQAKYGEGYHFAVLQAIKYMECNLAMKINLVQLADFCNIDKYYLIKLFRKQTGLTPMAYLQQIRISKAKELLLISDLSVEEIGESVGYIPASYFITIFKKCEQMTPLAFRKYWRHVNE